MRQLVCLTAQQLFKTNANNFVTYDENKRNKITNFIYTNYYSLKMYWTQIHQSNNIDCID